jgi:hypothetical protein
MVLIGSELLAVMPPPIAANPVAISAWTIPPLPFPSPGISFSDISGF